MDKEIIEILRNIQTEIQFISYGGRHSFMVEDEGQWWYVLKCWDCKDISLISWVNTHFDIKHYRCNKCIAADIKDGEIYGKMYCLSSECDNEDITGEEEYWEKICSWYCDECLKLPKIIKRIEDDKIEQQKINEKYEQYGKIYS